MNDFRNLFGEVRSLRDDRVPTSAGTLSRRAEYLQADVLNLQPTFHPGSQRAYPITILSDTPLAPSYFDARQTKVCGGYGTRFLC